MKDQKICASRSINYTVKWHLMSLFLNKTHQLRRNVYLTGGRLIKDNEQLKLALMGE